MGYKCGLQKIVLTTGVCKINTKEDFALIITLSAYVVQHNNSSHCFNKNTADTDDMSP